MYLLRIDDRLSLALLEIETAQRTLASHDPSQIVAFTKSRSSETSRFSLNDLGQLHRLTNHLDQILEQADAPHLVVCASDDKETVTACVSFLGSFLILLRGMPVDRVAGLFQSINDVLVTVVDPHQLIGSYCDELTVQDGWRAVQKAKDNGWLDFLNNGVEREGCIDMDEYLHYDSPANGRLHVVIPSKLIAFQCPSDLPTLQHLRPESEDRHWADAGGKRHFAPAFYAEILDSDYGVQLVVRCDADQADRTCHRPSGCAMEGARCQAGDRPPPPPTAAAAHYAAAFQQRGIAVERLAAAPAAAPGPAAIIKDIDRFLTLARLAPGPIALHGPGPGAGLGAGGEVLAAALLVQRHGFDGRAALAWLRIAHPPAPPPVLTLSLAPPARHQRR
jgi:hypothetical protein